MGMGGIKLNTMSSTSEKGHAKNVANFKKFIGFLKAFGANYNPSEKRMSINDLEAQQLMAADILTAIKSTDQELKTSINQRRAVFNPVKTYAARLVSTLKSTRPGKATIDDAAAYVRKMRGIRAKDLKAALPGDGNAQTQQQVAETHSVAQMSFSNLTEHLEGLNEVLKSVAKYNPNEAELQTKSVANLIAELRENNEAVDLAFIAADNNRNARNIKLYQDEQSLLNTVADVKNYVRGVFGISSKQFKQLSAIQFSDVF